MNNSNAFPRKDFGEAVTFHLLDKDHPWRERSWETVEPISVQEARQRTSYQLCVLRGEVDDVLSRLRREPETKQRFPAHLRVPATWRQLIPVARLPKAITTEFVVKDAAGAILPYHHRLRATRRTAAFLLKHYLDVRGVSLQKTPQARVELFLRLLTFVNPTEARRIWIEKMPAEYCPPVLKARRPITQIVPAAKTWLKRSSNKYDALEKRFRAGLMEHIEDYVMDGVDDAAVLAKIEATVSKIWSKQEKLLKRMAVFYSTRFMTSGLRVNRSMDFWQHDASVGPSLWGMGIWSKSTGGASFSRPVTHSDHGKIVNQARGDISNALNQATHGRSCSAPPVSCDLSLDCTPRFNEFLPVRPFGGWMP